MQHRSFYCHLKVVVMMLIMIQAVNLHSSYAAPSRFDVMKSMKWRVVDVLEQNLHSGLLSSDQKELTEYTIYKIKSSIGQFTNKEFFEDIYNQTHQLVKIKAFMSDSNHRNTIDNLIEFYQSVLSEMYISTED